MESKESTYELIENYLANELLPEERTAFENRLATDLELKKQVKLHEDIRRAILDSEEIQLEATLKEVTAQKEEPQFHKGIFVRFPFVKYMAAACIALLLGFGIYQGVSTVLHPGPGTVYAQYYEVYPAPTLVRGPSESDLSPKEAAFAEYEAKNYKKAREQFSQLIESNPSDMDLVFYQGMCALELSDGEAARTSFKFILSEGQNLYITQARWYSAMSYLKESDMENASSILSILSKEGGKYGNSAKAILNQ